MTLRTKVYGVVALAAIVAASGYVWKTQPQLFGVAQASTAPKPADNAKKGKEAAPVELATVKRDHISAFVTATANLRALRDFGVATQLEGVVQKVLTEEGDLVQEGQVLATLDDTQSRIKLKLAQEKLEQAQLQMEKARIQQEKALAQMGHAKIELERYTKAAAEGLVSDKEVATYRYKLEELQHDERVAASQTRELQHRVGELQAEIAQAKLEIERSQIRAPFAGHITQRMVNIGQRVRAMDALFNLGSFSPLYADVYLSESDTRSVKPGQPATVKLGTDEAVVANGRVERLAPIVDQSTGTVKVTVQLAAVQQFRPGAFVRVEIRTDSRPDAVLIPKRALVEEDGQFYVFVANKDAANRKKVEIGYQSEGMVEVKAGVQPGEKIVVAGQGALKEGAKIKAVQG